MPVETAEQSRWQAEEDAYTLVRAEEIKASNQRMKSAKDAAKRLLIEKEKSMLALRKVTNKEDTTTSNSFGRSVKSKVTQRR